MIRKDDFPLWEVQKKKKKKRLFSYELATQLNGQNQPLISKLMNLVALSGCKEGTKCVKMGWECPATRHTAPHGVLLLKCLNSMLICV